MAPIRVTLLASSIRPSRSISPSSSRARASASSAGGRRSSSPTGSGNSLIGGAGRGSAAVAVLPRAHVPGRVQRQRAQRARRPAGGHHPAGAGDERTGRPRGDRHPQRVGALLGVGEDRVLLDRLVARGGRPPPPRAPPPPPP